MIASGQGLPKLAYGWNCFQESLDVAITWRDEFWPPKVVVCYSRPIDQHVCRWLVEAPLAGGARHSRLSMRHGAKWSRASMAWLANREESSTRRHTALSCSVGSWQGLAGWLIPRLAPCRPPQASLATQTYTGSEAATTLLRMATCLSSGRQVSWERVVRAAGQTAFLDTGAEH